MTYFLIFCFGIPVVSFFLRGGGMQGGGVASSHFIGKYHQEISIFEQHPLLGPGIKLCVLDKFVSSRLSLITCLFIANH